MAKVNSHDFVGQNNRQTRGTSTASTDSYRSRCMDKQTHGSTSKDARRSMCMDISTESTGVSTVVKSLQGSR